jgi:putative transposase
MMDKGSYIAIDLGVDNLATIVTNTGTHPVLVKGKHIKAVNQYYNKMKAYYTGTSSVMACNRGKGSIPPGG